MPEIFSLESGDYPRAFEKLKEAAGLRSSRAEPWFGMGDSLVRQAYGAGDIRNTPILLEAIEAYNKAVAIEKRNNAASAQHEMGLARLAQAYVGLGDVYLWASILISPKRAFSTNKPKRLIPVHPTLMSGRQYYIWRKGNSARRRRSMKRP